MRIIYEPVAQSGLERCSYKAEVPGSNPGGLIFNLAFSNIIKLDSQRFEKSNPESFQFRILKLNKNWGLELVGSFIFTAGFE